jgi:hypothetical protein
VIEWLLDVLPPESGPYLMWAAGNFDLVQPLALMLCVGMLAAELALVAWWA